MRTFEVVLLCLLLAVQVSVYFFASSKGRLRRVPLACFSLLNFAFAIHLFFEGAHWQMGPAYLAVVFSAFPVLKPSLGRWWKITCVSTSLILVALTCGFSYVLPMFQMPTPTGAYAVGTSIVSMIDPHRMEDADLSSRRPRELIVQIWYPALPSRNSRAPYRRRSETTFASSYQSVDWTHSRYDPPVANAPGGFPILIYNPGWNGRRTQNTLLMEELASHGYVVVAIDHPYNSGPVALADGRVIRPVSTPELSDEVTPAPTVYALIDKEVEKETDDSLFVLNAMVQTNADPGAPFYKRLDVSKVGALGYSLGGAVAAECAYRDARIKAVLDLDTPLYSAAAKDGISQPFMLLFEDSPHTTDEERSHMSFGQRRDHEMDEGDYARQLPLLRKPGDYQIALHGTLHTSFQDVLFTSPLASISGGGAISATRMAPILRQYTVAFFDQSLRGIESPLLGSENSPFPEAMVLFRSAPSHDQSPPH